MTFQRNAVFVFATAALLFTGTWGCSSDDGDSAAPTETDGGDSTDRTDGGVATDGQSATDSSTSTDETDGSDGVDGADGRDGTDGASTDDSTDGATGTDGAAAADGTDGTVGPDVAPMDVPWPGWDNATVYFVIVDRFFDGNPANNGSYGRKGDGGDEVGTFHGGDFAGLTQKLEEGFFADLGVSALWVTAPYEQVHGWVVGGGGGFQHYAYHGYYPLDWTRVDANYGTEEEFRTFVDTAHSQGIRVILDVVMNHAGYATAQDLSELGVGVVQDGWQNATIETYYDFIDFESDNFKNWWGPQWIRADLGGNYSSPGTDLLTQSVSFLPDFKTESPVTGVKIPPIFANKADTGVVQQEGFRVRDYLISWLIGWVEEYGIDGFRCDTAKHVEKDAWGELSVAANAALRNWRANNPDKAFPDSDYRDPDNPFWMTGEVFPHGVSKDEYYTTGGFDSLINFDFQKDIDDVLQDIPSVDAIYADYASKINSDPEFNALTYISSHDTHLYFEEETGGDLRLQKLGGTLLLMSPGAVQVFYGDENARPEGPSGGDATQGTRSDYQFGANPEVFAHWSKVGLFRKRHRAIGAGDHTKVSDAPYAFRRAYAADVVYVAIEAQGSVTIDVSIDWADGATVLDYYTGNTAVVSDGKVTFEAGPDGVLLLEPAG